MISPSTPPSRDGNAVTAARWARCLRELGHRVRIQRTYAGEGCDLLLVLHARKSAAAVRRFHHDFPDRPLLVTLTGTDLYADLSRSATALRSLECATRIVLLQPLGKREIPARLRAKTVVIYQSALPPPVARSSTRTPRGYPARFDVAVLSHLRAVKDPLRAALAARRLQETSRLRILHAGRARSASLARRARLEMRRNPRYVWLGELSRARASRLLAQSRALVLSSRLEGGANVVSEAAVAGVPILASRIAGSVGLLGPRYPGYFAVGDTRGLARLLWRLENDIFFESALRRHLRRLAPRFTPERERDAWRRLLASLL
jgi:putative glycosyltransferase (TIGR04348 family)